MEPQTSMRGLLALLQSHRESLDANLRELQTEYDAERVFSHDRFDLDYDADLAACVTAGEPLLAAMDRTIGSVAAIVGRTRGDG